MKTSTLGPDLTIGELIAERPEARAKLRSFGIDTCCGGSLTLAQAAELRGVPIGSLLDSLREKSAKDSAAGVSSGGNVRNIISQHPSTRAVFARHGLLGCGGSGGPDEPIELFARVHEIPLEPLLEELDQAIAGKTQPMPVVAEPAKDDGSATLYRRFIYAALGCTTTLGATFGAYNLFAFHTAIGHASPQHNWSHASFQVMGFVLLFIMGVSYHTLPRFLASPLAHPKVARATFWLALSGLLLRNYGNLMPLVPAPIVGILGGSALQLAAIAGWAFVLFETWRRSRALAEPFQGFLLAGTLFWIASAVIQLAGAIHALVASEPNFAPRWNEPHYAAALFGGALLWTLGMFLRTGPHFLGLKPMREDLVGPSLALAVGGAATFTAGKLAPIGRVGFELQDAGLLGLALSLALYVLAVRILERRAEPGVGDRAFTWTLRLSFAFSLLFGAIGTLYALSDIFGSRFPTMAFDGARHAFGVGFVTLAIFGMAGRIVPVFTGAKLRWPRARNLGVVLIALGVLLRESEVVLALGGPNELLLVSGTSGFVAAAGVLLASASIVGTLRGGAIEKLPATPVAISKDANVAALVASHPEALAVLVEAGFAPLANPILRNTLARAVTLGQACRMHGIDVERVLADLRAACSHGERRRSLPTLGRST